MNSAHNNTSSKTSGSFVSYFIGFVLSLILTIIPFYLVMERLISGSAALLTLAGFAVAQLLVQLFLFLHLGRRGQRWNIVIFLFMLLVVFIVVVGSLWIMQNLHYNMSSPKQIDEHMIHQGQKGF